MAGVALRTQVSASWVAVLERTSTDPVMSNCRGTEKSSAKVVSPAFQRSSWIRPYLACARDHTGLDGQGHELLGVVFESRVGRQHNSPPSSLLAWG
jgi:hypothetical protein